MTEHPNDHRKLCATVKSRKALADRVCTVAARYGAAAVISPGILNSREVRVELSLGVYRVSMSFTGDSHVGAFLGHWDIEDRDTDRSSIYPAEFGADIRGNVNPYHHRKATTCEDSFDRFLVSIEGGLRCLTENGIRNFSP